MPPRTDRTDEWKIAEFDRRTVESLDLLREKVEKIELWQAGIKVKFAMFGTLFGVLGGVGIKLIESYFRLK